MRTPHLNKEKSKIEFAVKGALDTGNITMRGNQEHDYIRRSGDLHGPREDMKE